MDDTLETSLEVYTIRERAAFTLLVAGRAARAFAHDARLAARVAAALDAGWAWVEAQAITGDQLVYDHVLRDDDSGLAAEALPEQRAMQSMDAVVTALLYVAWHAYGQAGVLAVTDPVNESGEQNIALVVRAALASGSVTDGFLATARHAILRCARTSPATPRYYAPHVLGAPVRRAAVEALLNE